MSLRVLSYNIRFGGAGREQAIGAIINLCAPDIVILQEATRPDVVARLASACGMTSWGAMHGQSVAFLSRIGVAHYAWHPLRFGRRMYLELVLSGSNTRIFGVHLSAIHSNPTERRRTHELRSLLTDIAKQQHGLHLLTGDFNTLAPGEPLDLRRLPLRLRAMVWLTGRTIHWTTIRLMLDGGYLDGYRQFHSADEGYTFPTWDPHVRLDYLFLPKQFVSRLERCEVMRDLTGVRDASDHFPLLSQLSSE